MKAFKIHLIFLATLGFLLFQCTEQSTNPPEGPVTPSQGQLSFNLDMTNAPSDVVALQGKLFKEGQDTIVFDFEITDSLATALVNDIPAGIWTIQVDAFNSDSVIIYTGQTDVNVIPGQITPVYLHLNPTTGGLEIVVTWGETKKSALDFDGIDDIVTIPNPNRNLNLIGDIITVESWIYVRSISSHAPRIIDRSDNIKAEPDGDRYLLALEDDQTAHINVNGFSVSSNRIPLHQWIHIAGTYDGQILKIYVNGELKNSRAVRTHLNVQDSLLCIGNNTLNNRQFDGLISNVRIWKRALDVDEIKTVMLRDRIPYRLTRYLVAYWPFSEGEGQIVNDVAGENQGVLGWSVSKEPSDPKWVTIYR